MMQRHHKVMLWGVFYGLLVAGLSVGHPALTQADTPVFETADCAFPVPDGQTVDCGYLTVPEDRARADGRTIRLHVAIFRTPTPNPAPDPIVYLEGGPGGNALEQIPPLFHLRFAAFLRNRDFIMVDQRGTGYSEPALDCPELDTALLDMLDEPPDTAQINARSQAAVAECRQRLAADGVDLAAYNSVENAADFADLRRALGYADWNLYAVSYGTRLAQTILRDHPEGIRSVVLDSVYPLEANLYTALPGNAARAFDVLFAGCTADATCSAAYPTLEADFYALVDQLNAEPARFIIRQPLSGASYAMIFTGDHLVDFVFNMLYAADVIPALPALISDVGRGDFSTVSRLLGSNLIALDLVSVGMHLSVQCHEEVPFTSRAAIKAAYAAYPRLERAFNTEPYLTTGVIDLCQRWDVEQAGAVENEAVHSDIPALILAGEYDPVTPPEWGELVGANLSQHYFYVFPGVGHGAALARVACPLDVMHAFYDDPTTAPDASCIGSMSAPVFVVPPTTQTLTLAPFTSETFNINGVAPEGWQELSPGIYAPMAISQVILVQQAVDGSLAETLDLLAIQLGLDMAPQAAGSRTAHDLTWSLYEFDVQGLRLNLGLAESGGRTLIVLVQTPPNQRDKYYDSLFLAAVDGLTETE